MKQEDQISAIELNALFLEYRGKSEDFKNVVSFLSYLKILGKKAKGNWRDEIRDRQQKLRFDPVQPTIH